MNRLACLVIIIGVTSVSFAPALAGAGGDVAELIQKGNAALGSGKVEDAIKHFSAAIESDKDSDEAFRGRAAPTCKKGTATRCLRTSMPPSRSMAASKITWWCGPRSSAYAAISPPP